MIRIGVVNIDVSHPKAFSDYLLKENRARYVAVYNDGFRKDDEVESFIKNYGLEKRCPSIEELAECVDIGFVQSCNWDNHLKQAMPFIERGVPVFIDKPIVGNLQDCKRLKELVNKGAVILGSSSVRYAEEIVGFVNQPAEERGEIMNISGTCGVDEFNYGIHIVEAIGGLMGAGAESVKYVGNSEKDGKVCETFFLKYENGVTATYNTFMGIWQPFMITIMTTKGTFSFEIDCQKIYGALLDRICDYMENGKNKLASMEELTESIKIMLAAKISKQNNGQETNIQAIPKDDPGYDGDEFEKGYAANASKIYL